MGPRYGRNRDERRDQLTAAVAAALLIAAIIGVSLRQAASRRAITGDIIRLVPRQRPVHHHTARITAHIIDDAADRPCMFDLRVVERSGGSIVVDATQFDPALSYHVHWAGPRTSNDADDCGQTAELRVSPDLIAALSMAAAAR